MITAEINYRGNLRTEAIHKRSGVKIITDAPPDNQGKGEAFSPTDLMSTSLGNCMMTIMGILADAKGIDVSGMRIEVTKIMAASPRRVSEIICEVYLEEKNYTEKEKEMLENAARNCPVALSLHPDLKQVINFHY